MSRSINLGASRGIPILTLLGWMLLPAGGASGSSVTDMNLGTLAEHAGQVIVGQVDSVRSYWADSPRRIESEVQFKEVEYLKGKTATSLPQFTMVVPGGKVGHTQMRVCCAPEFKAGDRHVLFILPEYKTFPTVGLAQGVFTLQRDEDGVDRVYQRGGIPLLGFDDAGYARLARKPRCDARQRVRATNNVRIRPPAEPSAIMPMTYQALLEKLKPVLDASRDHKLAAPAGRRILIDYRAVPLKFATGGGAADDEEPPGTNQRPGQVRGTKKRIEVETTEGERLEAEGEVQR